ncbi:hypothetical protein KBI33_03095 [Candidatus Shapirobacteria bacterium]|nr:hypothetical protein [Candidatus Shapirobacteria bacterium]
MNEDFIKGKSREEKIDKFLDTMGWYFSEKTMPTGFYRTIGRIDEKLGQLIKMGDEFNKNIEEASKSSDKLTKALNNITLAGVIIAGLGIVIALANLIFEIYKYFHT